MAAQRKITVKTPLDADQLLIRAASVTEHLGQPFEIELDLLSPSESIDFSKVMGREMRVSVGLDDGGARHFHGFVSHFSQGSRLGRYASYKARVVPWLWFLSQTADCKIFQAKSASDIVKEVFREHGFTDFKDSLTKTYRTREYCVQYRESDYAFVQRLMEEEGIYYYFTHTESSHTLVLADSYSGHEAVPGKSIEYLPPSDNVVRDKDHIYDWRKTQELRPGKYVLTDYDFTKPRASLLTQYTQKRNIPKSEGEWFDYPGGYTATSDGDHYVRARLESLQWQFERLNGECNVRALGTGHLFKLEGYPRKDQNKEYLVVSATYRLDAGEYESETGLGEEDYTCTFEAIDSKEPFRAPIVMRKPRVGGSQTATVVGPGGEEIHTDKYGRVKVQFHWDRLGERNEKSSCWVRVSQIWAGKNWGWITIPRIGQEVVVDFLEGDPDQPMIVGRVYNQDNMPPYELPGNKTQSGIKTRSSPNGSADNCNEIRFEDKKGSEQLYIHAEKNQDISVENDETHSVGHDRKKDIGNDETTHVKANRTETVDKEETITIHGGRTETVDKEEKITISGGRTENVSKDESITIGGVRTESVAKDESITISGGRTENVSKNESITIGGGRTESVAKDESITISGGRTENVSKNETITIGGDRSLTVSKGETVSISKAQSVTVGDARTTSVSKNDSLSVGKTLDISAADAITITTGSASISMKKDGTITIKGKDITIDGSGKINVKASGDITMKGSKIKQN
jgi:type VI secretion system secreted protein VgrG